MSEIKVDPKPASASSDAKVPTKAPGTENVITTGSLLHPLQTVEPEPVTRPTQAEQHPQPANTEQHSEPLGPSSLDSGQGSFKVDGIVKSYSGQLTGASLYALAGYPKEVKSGGAVVPNDHKHVNVHQGQDFTTHN